MEDINIFSKVEEKTSVKKEDIIKLAKEAASKDLSKDKNIRSLIKEVAKIAGKEVSKEKEEKIREAIKKDKIPRDIKNIM
jgi:predicted transcriptional regulator